MMLRAACVLALVTGCAPRVEAQPSRPELVERASEYVSRFLTAFSNVVAEERYEQEATVGAAAADVALGTSAGALSERERLAGLPRRARSRWASGGWGA